MPELSMTENMLGIACRHDQKAKSKKEKDIYLLIDHLSSILYDSVQFYWDVISKDTLCEEANLYVNKETAVLVCLDCQTEYYLEHELITFPLVAAQ